MPNSPRPELADVGVELGEGVGAGGGVRVGGGEARVLDVGRVLTNEKRVLIVLTNERSASPGCGSSSVKSWRCSSTIWRHDYIIVNLEWLYNFQSGDMVILLEVPPSHELVVVK